MESMGNLREERDSVVVLPQSISDGEIGRP